MGGADAPAALGPAGPDGLLRGRRPLRRVRSARPQARALAQAERLATAVGLDMAGTWTATASGYFSRVSKARVLEAVAEATTPEEAGRIAGFKKGDMAEAAERLVEGRDGCRPCCAPPRRPKRTRAARAAQPRRSPRTAIPSPPNDRRRPCLKPAARLRARGAFLWRRRSAPRVGRHGLGVSGRTRPGGPTGTDSSMRQVTINRLRS